MSTVLDRAPTRKVRRPRKVQEIRQRLALPPFHGNPGVVQITDARGREKSYFLQPIGCDWGQAWRLETFASCLDADEPFGKYDLVEESGVVTCDCRGHVAHGHCKHAVALTRLVTAGQI